MPMSDPEPPRRQRARPDLKNLYDALQPSEVPRAKVVENGVGMTFVLVPAGSFNMGEAGFRTNETPVHDVVLTTAFYLSATPVTQHTYRMVTGQSPSFFTAERGGSPLHPVEQVSFDDAVRFCERLSARPDERAAARRYRLPTEAEWEYSARGGATTVFPFGDAFTATHGTFDARFPYPDGSATDQAATGTTAVGKFPTNSFGLLDVCGNVWEWCADWFDEKFYSTSPMRDPTGPPTGVMRVVRGGSWKNHAHACRPAYRNALPPHQKNTATGFRVVLEIG
jgi:formylglycine-generating enzyme required for sulfatase activity